MSEQDKRLCGEDICKYCGCCIACECECQFCLKCNRVVMYDVCTECGNCEGIVMKKPKYIFGV